jgi:hypothetical protein
MGEGAKAPARRASVRPLSPFRALPVQEAILSKFFADPTFLRHIVRSRHRCYDAAAFKARGWI